MRETVETIKITLSTILGIVSYWLGGNDELLTLLIILMGVDFLTGFMKAFINKSIDVDKMFLGGMKKIAIFVVIIVAVQIEIAFNQVLPFREIVIMYYITHEGLSFIENIGHFTKLPDELTQFFKTLQDDQRKDENNYD